MERPSRLFFYLRGLTARHPRLFGDHIVNWFIDHEDAWLDQA